MMPHESTQRAWTQTGNGSRIPHDLDAEREALGILLVHPDKLAGALASGLDIECFYPRHHRVIFRALSELGPGRKPADSTVVADRLTANLDMCELIACQGEHYLISLGRDFLCPDSLGYVIPRLRHLATARATMLSAAPSPFRSVADRMLELWSEPPPRTIPTGLAPLDRALEGGFMPESMVVLCAGTGRGKTGLVVQIGRHWLRLGMPVLFIETELSERQVHARFLAQVMDQPWREIFQSGSEVGPKLAEHARRELLDLCIWKWKRGQRITDLLNGYAQTLGKSPLLIIDQISDLARAQGTADMRHATASISAELKAAAEEYKTVVLAVAQTARAVTSDPDKSRRGRSYEGAAKDSGEVEADAATVLYLEGAASSRQGAASARLHIAKSRGGPCDDVVGLRFHAVVGRFVPDRDSELSPDQESALSAIAKLTANGTPVGMEKLKAALGMGQGRLKPILTILQTAGRITRDGHGVLISQPPRGA